MKPVQIPTSDVNSEYGTVVSWFADNRGPVDRDAVLVEVETSKAVLEVTAPESGVVLFLASEGQEIPLSRPVALVFADAEALAAYEEAERRRAAEAPSQGAGPRATLKALRRAEELGVDLAQLGGDRLITVKDVEQAATAHPETDYSAMPEPLTADQGVARVLLIGGGLGATQVMDILGADPAQQAVAILDDDRDKWGTKVDDVPIVGGSDRLAALFASGAYDAAVITISTSVPARQKLRKACQSAGVPLANVIDPTVRISGDVEMGEGNVICAFSHLGVGVRLGDNNFLSAYNSFDHHSTLGSDSSTGPGCMSSGLVTLGDGVRLGTGIFIEPHLEIGDGAQVASGATIVSSVPAHHAVKTKVFTTSVVPIRR